jgi:PhnB protein
MTTKPTASPSHKPAVKPIPDGYHSITPYLVVSNCAGLRDFLKNAFGGKELMEPMTGPDGKVMHTEVRVGDSVLMMGEASDKHPAMPGMLNLYVEDSDAVYEKALKAGGVSVMPMTDQFYGDRSGMVRDPSGNLWSISTHKEDVPPAEMARRAAEHSKKKA